MVCSYKKELKKGSKIELEHGKRMSKEIAKEHLEEYPCYYSSASIKGRNKLVSVKDKKKKKNSKINFGFIEL